MYTTLNNIREHNPCTDGWEKLLNHLGKTSPDDEPLPLLTILDSNGFDYALWCFRAVDGFDKEKLLLGIGYAKEVEHLMPAKSKKALDVFERYANGLATQEEFKIARKAAADVSYAAWIAAYAAAYAAAARAASHTAADTDVYAAWSAARAADAAAYATEDAARAAADAYVYAYSRTRTRPRSAIEDKQEIQLRELLEKTCTQL